MPVFPFVPNVPGVPAVARAPGSSAPVVGILVADAFLLLGALLRPVWAVVDDNGFPVLTPEVFVGVDYGKGWQISNYPVEQGSFQSYDKVEMPFDFRIRIASGSSLAARTLLLNQVEAIQGNVNLYSVITPERIYSQCNVAHVGYFRTAERGVGLLMFDVGFLQIRNTASSSFTNVNADGTQQAASITNAKSPTGDSPVPGGSVQPSTPTPAFVNQADPFAVRPT